MLGPLLATKLHRPAARGDLVARGRLIAALDGALAPGRRLILISAPAGFGKTTLLAEWLGRPGTGASVAWLSLDRDDDDPALFWNYAIAALQTIDPGVGRGARAALESPPLPPMERLLATLINDLAALSGPVLLVLDDYHLITAEAVHAGMNFFLDHLPATVCLVVATRQDPPLTLARRRARAEMAELRVADLRFTLDEARAFLNEVVALDLPAGDVAALQQRTEGWAAGLRLAAHSLLEHHDRHAFVAAFAGDDRYVVDYLLEEVLDRLSPALQSFLVHTALLERLCGPLCDALLETLPCPPAPASSAAVLDALERANLFVTSLDNRRQWYRYHQLFGDLLRKRLREAASAEQIRRLYESACAWYEREGYSVEAVDQALAARDYPLAASLLERHVLTVFFRGETLLVYRWLHALPEALVRARPLLAAVYGDLFLLVEPEGAATLLRMEEWLDIAAQALADHPPADRRTRDLARSTIALFRTYLAYYQRAAPARVLELARAALASLPPDEAYPAEAGFMRFRSALANSIGLAQMALGDESAAAEAFAQAYRIGTECGDLFNAFAGAHWLAGLAHRHGDLQRAAAICRDALNAAARGGAATARPAPHAGALHHMLGGLLVEWDELDAAEPELARALELLRLTTPAMRLGVYLDLARLRQARRDFDGALAMLAKGAEFAAGLAPVIETMRVRVRLAQAWQGPLPAPVDAWARDRLLPLPDAACPSWIEHAEWATLVRVRIARARATGDPAHLAGALDFIRSQHRAAERERYESRALEWAMLEALALAAVRRLAEGVTALRHALALAGPGGFKRQFLEEGRPMAELLQRLADEDSAAGDYARRLLRAFGETAYRAAGAHPSLAEPLHPRELQVLRLMADDLTNAEIAARLVVSVHTVKKHVSNILGKLDVSSRDEAVARARGLGLLPRN